jgi:Zn-dependent M28 family amino/carboxypeptidase
LRLLTVMLVVLIIGLHAQQSPGAAMPSVPKIPGMTPTAEKSLGAIDPEKIRAHVCFLASDLLEGRGPGQRGGMLAAEYVATQFALYGLKPAGENGSYFQTVPMVNIRTLPKTTFTLTAKNGDAQTLQGGEDYIAVNQTLRPESDIEAPIVFVGYGINAPEYKWNDYAGADVKGKVVLMFVNEPPSPLPATDEAFFKGKALTYYGRWTYKFEEAARQGAVGAILIHQTQMASYPWTVLSRGWGSEQAYLRSDPKPKLQVASWIRFEVARKLFASCGLDIDKVMEQMRQSGFRALPLGATLKAHLVGSVREFDGKNVIARLQGTDATQASHAVLYTAHHDHFGIVPEKSGDNIYNGAIDNATGVAMLLEIARVFAESPPGRSVLFATVDAEEQGLLGSEYLGEHPPLPARNIVLNLNFEGLFIMPVGVPEELQVSGAGRTTFYSEVEQVARAFSMSIKPDPFPEAGYYYRSDHFSLARVGVPAFSVASGNKFAGHDESWGESQAKDYVAHRYHQPSDEYRPEMDFRANARTAQVAFALGWRAAQPSLSIDWLPGDEFETARKRSQQAH